MQQKYVTYAKPAQQPMFAYSVLNPSVPNA